MADLATLNAYKDALLKALGSGTLSVNASGVSRTFRSVSDLQRAIVAIDGQIRAAGGGSPRISQIQISTSKGW